jgi:parallel beta-helix repeat protein
LTGYPTISLADFLHTIENNTVNARPLYYAASQDRVRVPTDAGQVLLVNCTNASVCDLRLNGCDFPIILAYCHGSIVANNTIEDSEGEVLFFSCRQVLIQNNTIAGIIKGVCLEFQSSDNIVRNNTFERNMVGISLYTDANNNSVYGNIVRNSSYAAIQLESFHEGTQKDNMVFENLVCHSYYGLHLNNGAVGNTFARNTIRHTTFPAFVRNSRDNLFQNNFWERPRILPKLILGFPLPDIDWHPALRPYIDCQGQLYHI